MRALVLAPVEPVRVEAVGPLQSLREHSVSVQLLVRAEVVSAPSVWTVRPSRPVSEHPMSVPAVVLGPAEPVRAQVVSARSV